MKKLIFLAAGMFTMGFEDYLFAGLLPGISFSLNSNIVAVAQGCASFGLAYTLSIPLCALLLTKRSVRYVLILSLSLFLIGNAFILLSQNLWPYLLSRFVSGLGGGLFLPVAVASGTQSVEAKFRGRALGMMWSFNSAGAVIGVPIGLFIASKWGWQATIIIIMIMAFIALLGILLDRQALKMESVPPTLREQFSLLVDRRVLAIIGVTFLTATGCLGLYSYISEVLSGTNNSPDFAFSLWSIGGLVGSSAVGYVIDRNILPQKIMAVILFILLLTILSIPILRDIPYFGLIPFFIWGAMGWASVMPQQYSLLKIKAEHDAILVALNSTTVGLGSSVGTALLGIALKTGMSAKSLAFVTALFVFMAFLSHALLNIKFLKQLAEHAKNSIKFSNSI